MSSMERLWCLLGVHRWVDFGDRRQKCQCCGISRVERCAHEWEEVDTFQGSYSCDGGKFYGKILKCKKCGEQIRVDLI